MEGMSTQCWKGIEFQVEFRGWEGVRISISADGFLVRVKFKQK